jgi:HK97 family phage portal protein
MLGRLLGNTTEQRAITYQSLFLTDGLFAPASLSGVQVTSATATKVAAVFASIRLIADSIATMPLDTFIRRDGERVPFRPRPAWVDQPDVDRSVARSDFYQAVLVSILLNGNAYVRIIREGGDILGFRVLDPMRVTAQMDRRGLTEFVFDHTQVIPSDDMVHITDIRRPGAITGMARVDELKDVLGIARALDEYAARYFGNGTLSSGIINVPGELTQEQADRLKDQFEKNSKGLRNAHRPNILTGGAKFEKMSADAQEAQLSESREFAVREIARVFKIQPIMLGITDGGGMSQASVEQQHIQFVTITLRPYVHKLEEAFSRLLPAQAFLRFNMDGLLRGDLQSRFTAYSIGTQAGFLSTNDVRRREDLPPVDGGDAHRVPLANVNLEAANIVEQDRRVAMAVRLINVGFEPAEVLASLDLPAMEHTGLPSVQLQNAALQAQAEVDVTEAYPVREADLDPLEIAQQFGLSLSDTLRNMPAPVVNVTVPEQPARTRKVKRDADGNIMEIVEE